jgi:hypothetical protein
MKAKHFIDRISNRIYNDDKSCAGATTNCLIIFFLITNSVIAEEAAPEPTITMPEGGTEGAGPELPHEAGSDYGSSEPMSDGPSESMGDPEYDPKIYFIPYILSFPKSDWKLDHGKRIKIAVNNPQNCHIIHASIKLKIPSGWEFYPDTNNNVVNFDPDKSLFWIQNFGNFTHNYTESWVEIKPGPSISEGIYNMSVDSLIFFKNKNIGIDYSKNFSTLIYLKVVDDIKEPESNPLKNNIYIFVIIGATCALIGLVLNFRQKR